MAVKIESNFLMMHNVVRKKNPLLKQTIYIVVPKYKPKYIHRTKICITKNDHCNSHAFMIPTTRM